MIWSTQKITRLNHTCARPIIYFQVRVFFGFYAEQFSQFHVAPGVVPKAACAQNGSPLSRKSPTVKGATTLPTPRNSSLASTRS
jgi:hypothetical protein